MCPDILLSQVVDSEVLVELGSSYKVIPLMKYKNKFY